VSNPLLIVVTGMPGAGKTTVGTALAKELQLGSGGRTGQPVFMRFRQVDLTARMPRTV